MQTDKPTREDLEAKIKELENENLSLKDKLYFHELFNDFSNTWETFRDQNGKLIYMSPAFSQITGFDLNEYSEGKNIFFNFVHPDDLETAKQFFQKQIDKYQFSNLVCRIYDKNKTLKYISVSSRPVFNKKNEYIGFRTSCIDISTQKKSELLLKESNEKIIAQNKEYAQINEEFLQTNQELQKAKEIAEKNEQALKKSNERFTLLTNLVPAHIAYVNAETLCYEFANSEYQKSFGIPLDKVAETPVKDVIVERNFEFALEYIEIVKSGKPVSYENTFKMQDGIHWISVNYVPEFDSEGKVISIIVLSYDISERKQAELDSAEREKHLQLLVKGTFDYYFRLKIDETGKPIMDFISENYSIIPGRNLSDVETIESWGKIIHPEDIQKLYQAFDTILKTKKEINFECRSFLDNQIRFVEINAVPVLEPKSENVTHILGNVKDHSTKKLSELKLKNIQEKYQLIAENTSDVIWIINKKTQKTTYVSLSVFQLTGFTAEEYAAKNFKEFIHPKTIEFLEKEIPERIAKFYSGDISQKNRIYEMQQICKNGTVVWTEVSTTLRVNEQGSVTDFIGVMRNIEERKKSELAARKTNRELKKLNSDKDRFISILAHDLRSPFNSILGYLELLKENIRYYDIDKIEQQIHIIDKSANNVFRLLDEILLWVRSQSGKIPFEPEKLNFGEICEEIFENIRAATESKNLKIRYFTSGEISLFADINMFKTVLRNLISNACKFTNAGGKIDVFAEKNHKSITVTIADNGIGMDSETQSKLFSILPVNSIKGTSDEIGNGIGLLICKEFIEKHGGRIWAESEIGKGSRFIFSIPLSQ